MGQDLGEKEDLKITFDPPFQNWHDNQSISITIDSAQTISPLYELKFYYNGRELTQELQAQAQMRWEKLGTRLVITLPHMRFLPGRQNDLGIYFRPDPSSDYVLAHHRTPECPLQEDWPIVAEHLPLMGKNLIKSLQLHANNNTINPAMLASLIQQESNFDSRAVSSAKAIGLTQVTPVTSKEILKKFPHWPQDQRAEELPANLLRILIQTGLMNREHDWRLDDQRSIQGGATYISYLGRLWQSPDYQMILSTLERPAFEDIVLASYHSGPNRVREAMRQHSDQWSLASDLRQARYYIGKVKSYCSLHTPVRMANK
jgi:hypothetical protein